MFTFYSKSSCKLVCLKLHYSKLDWEWTLFYIEAKKKRHEEVFPKECETAFKLGGELV